MNNNKPYALSFCVKGAGMEHMRYNFASQFSGVPESAKVERGELKNREVYAKEYVDIGENFSAGSNWSNVGWTLNIHYSNTDLHNKPTITGGVYIDFWVTNLSSVLYLDDSNFSSKQ